MTRLILPVPEPVRTYLSDAALTESIDRLGETADTVPVDLTWEEVVPFHEARLAAQAVRLAHLRFYEQIWDAVWGPALGRHGRIGFDRIQHHDRHALPTLKIIFTDRLHRIVRADPDGKSTSDNWLYASVGNTIDDDAPDLRTVLRIWVARDDHDVLSRQLPDDGWSPIDEDGYSEVMPRSVYAKDYSEIDLTDAAAAVGRLAAALRAS